MTDLRPWHRSEAERRICIEIHDGKCPHQHENPPCGTSCPGECGWNPNDPEDPCVMPPASTAEQGAIS